MKKIVKKTIKYLLVAVVVLILFYTALIVIFDMGDVLPFQFTRVVSGSMEPTIKTGALCLIVNNPHSVKVGDVIVFNNAELYGSKAIIHRVIDIQNEQILTKGDHNMTADTYIDQECVMAKTVKIFNFASAFYFPKIMNLAKDSSFRVLLKSLYILSITILAALCFDWTKVYNQFKTIKERI